jgi:hypothetical protein
VSASSTEFIQKTLRAHVASGWSVTRPARASASSASAYQRAISRFFSTNVSMRFTWATPIAAWS